MAKKSFKENPALSFISQALAEAAVPPSTTPTKIPQPKKTDKAPPADEQIPYTDADMYTHTHIAKPTDVHISTDEYEDEAVSTHVSVQAELEETFAETPPEPEPAASGITGRGESKSKRLQLLLRPSTHEGVARLAKASQTSVNDTINQILEDYLRKL